MHAKLPDPTANDRSIPTDRGGKGRSLWREKFERSRYFFLALLLHLIILLMIATLVMWPAQTPPATEVFNLVSIKTPPPAPPPPPVRSATSGGGSFNPQFDPDQAPVVAKLPSVITSVHSAFTVDASSLLHQTPQMSSLPKGIGFGTGSGNGNGSGSGLGGLTAAPVLQQLAKLLFKLPCVGPDNGSCALTDDHSYTVQVADDDVHTCTMLVRGVAEQATYDGGKISHTYLCTGGTPDTGVFNIYELKVDDPPQTYYLNAGKSGLSGVFVLNYTMQIQVKNGSKVSLHVNSIDSAENTNAKLISAPDHDPDHPIAVQQPFQGQFIQVDAISMDDDN